MTTGDLIDEREEKKLFGKKNNWYDQSNSWISELIAAHVQTIQLKRNCANEQC